MRYVRNVALPILPGELVVRKQRWHVDANLLGIVIGKENDSWLVLWTTGDRQSKFQWHLPEALLVVDTIDLAGIAGRGTLHP